VDVDLPPNVGEIPGVDVDLQLYEVTSGMEGSHNDDNDNVPPLVAKGYEIDSSDDEDNDDSDYGGSKNGDDTPEVVYHPDLMTPSLQRANRLWPAKPHNYSNLHVNVIHHAVTQYSLKK
jgi:hypothetical protein